MPLAGLVVALTLSGTAASAALRPSERGCLLAWNAPANVASRQTVVASGPWSSASLRPGVTSTVTWQRGSTSKQTTAQVCLLTLVKSRGFRIVTGVWRDGRVVQWSFGRTITAGKAPGGSNVKLLPDGRVTKA